MARSFSALVLDDDDFAYTYLAWNLPLPTNVRADWKHAQAQRDAQIEDERNIDYDLALRQVRQAAPNPSKNRVRENH
jgi:hypothetical protein